MENNQRFTVEYTTEAAEFIRSLNPKASTKILQIITVASQTNDPEKFKKLQGTDIWEFRCLYNKTHYRLFAFWDTMQCAVVIATHGIIKKTQKTPDKEIKTAEQIRQEYFKSNN